MKNNKYFYFNIIFSTTIIAVLVFCMVKIMRLESYIKLSENNSVTTLNLNEERLDMINTKDSVAGNTNIANFSGQDLGTSAPIGQIVHNYTDGIAVQVDNVGENNTILVLKNAYNPSRRPDKDNKFIGTANFLQLLEHTDGENSKRILTINKDGDLIWLDSNKTTVLGNNKIDDSTPAFQLEAYQVHEKLFAIRNGGKTAFEITNSKNETVDLIAGQDSKNGMNLKTVNGNIEFSPNSEKVIVNGEIYIKNGDNTYSLIKNMVGTTTERPTDVTKLKTGDIYFDTSLNKPIWRNSSNDGWVDSQGNAV